MHTPIRNFAAGRRFYVVAFALLMLAAGQTAAASPVAADDKTVDVVGNVRAVQLPSEGGCEIYTVLEWPALAGDPSYTVDMHDAWGYSFVASYPPFNYDGQYESLPPVGSGMHRQPLTYQAGGGPCSGFNDDVARYTILSFIATYPNNDGRIVGSVTDKAGAGIADVAITISGASSSTQQTNAAGAYGKSVTKGQYTVSAPSGYCVVGGGTCSRSKSVDVQGPVSVNFVKSSGEATVSGLVTERTCTEESCTEAGLPGVLVSAVGPDGGEQLTDDDGRYSITVGAGHYVVTPTLEEREFDPPSKEFTVEAGDTETANFVTCAHDVAPATLTADAETVACETLHIDWTMPAHIQSKGWNDEEPSQTYVNPVGGWKVNLFLKDAAGKPLTCATDRTWTWKVSPRGTTATTVYPEKSCKFSPKVPREGVYTVTVEEHRKSDDHLMAKGTKDVVVQDFLIVGMGDSNASGQGNPPYWNRQCDRSVSSYQMIAAKQVEDADSRTSVTFIHLACSGARTVHIADKTYVGQEPTGQSLPSQMIQLRRVLRFGHPDREIDALLLSAGINDLRFGGIVGICLDNAFPNTPCQKQYVRRVQDANGEPTLKPALQGTHGDGTMKHVVNEELAALPGRIAQMAASMANLVAFDPARVIMTTYPDESWRAEGKLCDDTSGYRPRLNASEWGWLSEAGQKLNAAVAAGPFPSITTIPGLFIGHGYCTESSKNWFRSLHDSILFQGNVYGTFHATGTGHVMMGFEVKHVLCPQLFNGSLVCKGTAREPGTGTAP